MMTDKLLAVTVNGSLLILLTVFIRKWLAYRIAREMIIFFWGITCIVCLFPFTIKLPVHTPVKEVELFRQAVERPTQLLTEIPTTAPVSAAAKSFSIYPEQIILGIYLTGLLIFGLIILRNYLKNRQLIAEALPLDDSTYAFLKEKIEALTCQSIVFKQSDYLSSPIVAGIFSPKIVLPSKFQYSDEEVIQLVLTHEVTHIHHRDNLKKMVMLLVLWLHWFNPLVWLMYELFNRDIEIVCDNISLKILGDKYRKKYAYTLLYWNTANKNLLNMNHYFSANQIKERIEILMRKKGKNRMFTLVALTAVIGTGLLLVTRPATASVSMEENEMAAKVSEQETMSSTTNQESADTSQELREDNISKAVSNQKPTKADYEFNYLEKYYDVITKQAQEDGYSSALFYDPPTQEGIDGLNESTQELYDYAASYGLSVDKVPLYVNAKKENLTDEEISLFEQHIVGAAYLEKEEFLVIRHPEYENNLEQYRVTYSDGTTYRTSFVYDTKLDCLVMITNEDYAYEKGHGIEIRHAVTDNFDILYEISRTEYNNNEY